MENSILNFIRLHYDSKNLAISPKKVLKVTKFVYGFKWKRKFNELKRLSLRENCSATPALTENEAPESTT